MKKLLIWTAVIAIALVVGFYSLNSYVYNEKQGNGEETIVAEENFEGEADPSRMTLGMTDWRWVSATDKDGSVTKPKEFGVFKLIFADDGRFSATTDCNSMGGSYVADKGSISFSDVFSTKMYCEGSQESDFAALISGSQSYRFTSRGELILESESGKTVFR